MRFLFLIGAVALCATSSINANPFADKNAKAAVALRKSVNTFSLNFLRAIDDGKEKSRVSSPLSVSTLLTMMYFGAKSNTRKQLRKGLVLPKDDTTIRTGYSRLIESLNNYKTVELRLANKIYLNYDVTPKKSFTDVVTKDFKGEVETIDFSNGQKASYLINDWGKTKTNGHITDIIKPDDVDQSTIAVLVNAVYFKGSWRSKFNVDDTKDRPFNIDAATKVDVPTMYRLGFFEYGELPNLDATFVKLPYEMAEDNSDDDMYMVIVRPNKVDGLAKLIEGIKPETMEKLRWGASRNCHVFLPKFKIESELPLVHTLEKMKMTDMFVEGVADFSGIVSSGPVNVNKVVQKAFIDVNEHGSEAGAMSYGDLGMRFGDVEEQPDVTFKVDRPFLALIMVGLKEPTIAFASTWYGPERC